MTFTEIVTAIADRLNLTATEDLDRIGRTINQKYREITASLGIKHTSRRTTVQATTSIGVSTLQFTSAEKVVTVVNRNTTPYTPLTEVTLDELEAQMPFNASNSPTQYAVKSIAANTVTILLNCTPQTAFALYADVYSTAATLSGSDTPTFSESYHDILKSAALVEEYLKLEKPTLSKIEEGNVEKRMGELRHWIAVSTTKEQYQSKTASQSSFGGGTGGSGSSANGSLSYTQTGLVTFDRSSAAPNDEPFAVAVGANKVTNLDADKLDGLDSTAFALATDLSAYTPLASFNTHHTRHESGGADAIKLDDLSAPDDNTDLNVSSAKHGLAPKSPSDATQFLNGAATPAFATVKDSDLSTSDITTNNVTTAKHGFVPKAPNSITQFLRGDASWSVLPVTVDTEVTTTSTGSQNDFAPGLSGHTLLRCNNASTLTITGFSGGSAGQRITIVSVGAGQVFFKHQNGSSSAANRLNNFISSGDTPIAAGTGVAVYEYDGTTSRWRLITHDQGAWITAAFSAGDFTGTTAAWTVDAGDVQTSSYLVRGRTVFYRFYLGTTSTAAGATVLNILNGQWGGYTVSKQTLVPAVYNDGGGGNTVGFAQATDGTGTIGIFKLSGSFGAATNTTGVFGEIFFEVT